MKYEKIVAILDKEIEFTYCKGCGVLVFDIELHDKWHENMGEIASAARNADMMTRPIGPGFSATMDLPQSLIDRAVAARKKVQE